MVAVSWPEAGAIVRGGSTVCSGTAAQANAIVWTNTWDGGAASGMLAGADEWSLDLSCGNGTNMLSVMAVSGGGAAATDSVMFVADQSPIVITSHCVGFVMNAVTLTIGGTGAYLQNNM